MYIFNIEVSLLLQGLLAIVVIGTFYSLYLSTKAYGGIVGMAIKLIGTGTLFITISLIQRSLVVFGFIPEGYNPLLIGDGLNILALICLGFGFSKLASASKS